MNSTRSNGLLSIADLREITGYERVGDVRRCLERQNIRYFFGRDGVWTTIGLVEAAGGLMRGADDPEVLAPEGFR